MRHGAVALALLLACAASAAGPDFHTSPACWDAPRVVHAGPPAAEFANRLHLIDVPGGTTPAGDQLPAPEGAARLWLRNPDTTQPGPWGAALIVDAPIQRMAGFEKLVQQLDQAQIVAETEIRTWKLPKVELNAAAATLRELAADGHLGATDAGTTVSVTTDAASDTLIVSGPSAIFTRVDSVIKSLESGPQRVHMMCAASVRVRACRLRVCMRQMRRRRCA